MTTATDELLELRAYMSDADRETVDAMVAQAAPQRSIRSLSPDIPEAWERRVKLTFPRYASQPFADRHAELWEWENAIRGESCPNPFVAVWSRGGAKSTSAEMIAADLGCRGMRRYCLYVRMTQMQADKSVGNIAALLEGKEVARYYPEHADRRVGKYGSSKGWRREQLRTKGGYTVDAIGLDTAARGTKVEEDRPDLIIFDDIDALDDTPATTQKKIDIITKSILPAGTKKTAVLFIQNQIIRHGVCSQLVDGRADFLALRIVSGPHPALVDFKYDWRVDEATGIRRAVITSGTPTWEGQDLEACQSFIDTWGLTAFLKEAQHEVGGKPEGVSLRFDRARHQVQLSDDDVRQLVRRGTTFGGIDFGSWRFAFSLFVVMPDGRVVRINEIFSQRETEAERVARERRDPDSLPPEALSSRARAIHEMCLLAGIEDPRPRTVPLWGDAANPTDITEINLAFRRGWPEYDEDGEQTGWVTSKLRVVAVMNENKARVTAVTRINDVLDRNVLKFRQVSYPWRLGHNVAKIGREQTGSRLVYEMENWAVPVPRNPEDPQEQSPDDDTADGADLIASMRYALMSWWRPGKPPADAGTQPDDAVKPFDYKRGRAIEKPHVADTLLDPSRRRPSVRGPRPRL